MSYIDLRELSDDQSEAIQQAIQALGNGPFIEEWEFEIRVGISKAEFKRILKAWPNIQLQADSMEAALINNTLNEFCYGLTISTEQWREWFRTDKQSLTETYSKWSKLLGRDRTGIM